MLDNLNPLPLHLRPITPLTRTRGPTKRTDLRFLFSNLKYLPHSDGDLNCAQTQKTCLCHDPLFQYLQIYLFILSFLFPQPPMHMTTDPPSSLSLKINKGHPDSGPPILSNSIILLLPSSGTLDSLPLFSSSFTCHLFGRSFLATLTFQYLIQTHLSTSCFIFCFTHLPLSCLPLLPPWPRLDLIQ